MNKKQQEYKKPLMRHDKFINYLLLPSLIYFIMLILLFSKTVSYANETAAEIAASGITFKEE